MSVAGLCEICTDGRVDFTCPRCGSLVCDDHYDEETGLCVECAAEVSEGGQDDRPGRGDRPDGVDEYQF